MAKMKKLSFIDKALLGSIIKKFSLEENFLKRLSRSLGISEDLIKKRLNTNYKQGIIREITIPLSWREFGYKSSLFALEISSSRIKTLKSTLEKFPGVTHCNLRKSKLNIWFTFIYDNTNEKDKLINKLKSINIGKIIELPTEKVLKLDTSSLL